MRLQAEVTGLFDQPGDANSLLYTPLSDSLTARHTRRYTLEYTGEEAALIAFLRKVLADPVSHALHTGGAPALTGYAFFIDYGMKSGALDHEKETILAHHRNPAGGGASPSTFQIQDLKIQQRIYLFGAGDSAKHSERFVKDIVNPAIHTWQVTAA